MHLVGRMGVSDRSACGRGRAEPRHSSDTSPSGRHRPGSNQQGMDATPSTQSCYRRCNSARFTHHTVLPVRAWPALTVHPGFASYNIRKALVCRQFRRFTGGVDVFRTCAIPSAGARVSAHATRPVSDSWRMCQARRFVGCAGCWGVWGATCPKSQRRGFSWPRWTTEPPRVSSRVHRRVHGVAQQLPVDGVG